jgi:hypothetical protein
MSLTSPVTATDIVRGLLAIEDARIATGAFKPNAAAQKIIDDARAFLSSGVAQCQQQWRPIETAPKDGTFIDLWFPNNGTTALSQRLTGTWRHDAWFMQSGGRSFRMDNPTHWMPLPAGPSDTSTDRPDGYRDAWLQMIAHCNEVKAHRFRLEQTIRDSIEALERNSTSAPVVECLKAALPVCIRGADREKLEIERLRAEVEQLKANQAGSVRMRPGFEYRMYPRSKYGE